MNRVRGGSRNEHNRLRANHDRLAAHHHFTFTLKNPEDLIEIGMLIDWSAGPGLQDLQNKLYRVCDISRQQHPEVDASAMKWLSIR